MRKGQAWFNPGDCDKKCARVPRRTDGECGEKGGDASLPFCPMGNLGLTFRELQRLRVRKVIAWAF